MFEIVVVYYKSEDTPTSKETSSWAYCEARNRCISNHTTNAMGERDINAGSKDDNLQRTHSSCDQLAD